MFARALFGALDEIALAWLVRRPGSKASIELPRAAEQLGELFIEGLAPVNEGVAVKILVPLKRVADPDNATR